MSSDDIEGQTSRSIDQVVDGGDILTRGIEEGMVVQTPFSIIMKKRYGNSRIQDWDQSRSIYAKPDASAAYVLLEGELLDVTEEVNMRSLEEWLESELHQPQGNEPAVA